MAFDERLRRRVRMVCNRHGVSLGAFASYNSFALQVDKTRKQVHGHDLEIVIGALVERNVRMGLDREVLKAIAYEVFNVRVPNRE
jgi:hypothetical protein